MYYLYAYAYIYTYVCIYMIKSHCTNFKNVLCNLHDYLLVGRAENFNKDFI